MELRTEPEDASALRTVATGGLTLDHVWTVVAIAAAGIFALLGRMHTADLAYHLRAGIDILTSHRLPRVDTYTFSVPGRTWVDQQWGAQVVLALAYRIGGFGALAFLRAAIVATAFGFLWLACRARGASPRTSALLTIGGLGVAVLNTGMRPQTLAYPLFTCSLWILAARRSHPRRLWALPIVAVCWANLHGSFGLLPLLIALAAIEDVRDRAATLRTTATVGAATVGATLVNPFGLGAWRYAVGIATNARIRDQIVEWQPTSVRTVAGVLFFLSALAVAAFLARRAASTDRITLLWLGTFFVLALPALRGIVWWGFVVPVVLAGLLPTGRGAAERRGNPATNLLVVAMLIALVGVLLPWWRAAPDPRTDASALLELAPQRLVDAARTDLPPGARLLVSQPIASWFEFAWPSAPVFVDSRIELFPDGIWADYDAVMAGREGWQGILDRWRVDAVVLMPGDTALASLLSRDRGWRLAYRDGQGSVYVRA